MAKKILSKECREIISRAALTEGLLLDEWADKYDTLVMAEVFKQERNNMPTGDYTDLTDLTTYVNNYYTYQNPAITPGTRVSLDANGLNAPVVNAPVGFVLRNFNDASVGVVLQDPSYSARYYSWDRDYYDNNIAYPELAVMPPCSFEQPAQTHIEDEILLPISKNLNVEDEL